MLDISSDLPGEKILDLSLCAQQTALAEIGLATASAVEELDHILVELLQISVPGGKAVGVLPVCTGKDGNNTGDGTCDMFCQFPQLGAA